MSNTEVMKQSAVKLAGKHPKNKIHRTAGGPALFHASIIRVLGLSARHYKELMMRYQQFVMLQSG